MYVPIDTRYSQKKRLSSAPFGGGAILRLTGIAVVSCIPRGCQWHVTADTAYLCDQAPLLFLL